jgi:hypothetical protein
MEMKMKHDDVFTKDSSGIIILLAAFLVLIASVLFSGSPAAAKQIEVRVAGEAPQHIEVIEVVATRLK